MPVPSRRCTWKAPVVAGAARPRHFGASRGQPRYSILGCCPPLPWLFGAGAACGEREQPAAVLDVETTATALKLGPGAAKARPAPGTPQPPPAQQGLILPRTPPASPHRPWACSPRGCSFYKCSFQPGFAVLLLFEGWSHKYCSVALVSAVITSESTNCFQEGTNCFQVGTTGLAAAPAHPLPSPRWCSGAVHPHPEPSPLHSGDGEGKGETL